MASISSSTCRAVYVHRLDEAQLDTKQIALVAVVHAWPTKKGLHACQRRTPWARRLAVAYDVAGEELNVGAGPTHRGKFFLPKNACTRSEDKQVD